jgi:hypothetical protein
MVGSTLEEERWLEDYARSALADVILAAKLYSESKTDPVFLMQSLFHSQQAAEKAFKLFSVSTGLKNIGELKEKLGHHPLLNTYKLLINETENVVKKISKNLPAEAKRIEKTIECYESTIKEILHDIKNSSCYERIQKALEFQLSLSSNLTECSNKLLKVFCELTKFPKAADHIRVRLMLFQAAIQFVYSTVEKTPGLKEHVQQGEPLTHEQLKEIIKVIRTSLSEWEFVRENLLKMLENPPEELAQVLESLPPKAQETLRSACEDPVTLLQFLTLEGTESDKKAKSDLEEKQQEELEKIVRISNLLLPPLALGSLRLPDGWPLLDHVICLDVFSECGRYVEVGDHETSLELIARKADVARSLILAAELWTIILVGYCDILKTARKTAKREEG